jgi:hypothetical protein
MVHIPSQGRKSAALALTIYKKLRDECIVEHGEDACAK